jgi:ABC-type nitrate/sulfonate/bicarbonate transport system substrate-binding protein
MNKFRAFIGMFFLAVSIGQSEEVIRIGIGTQDTTINCAAGGAVVRELHLLEKYLPHDGRYKDIKYEIVWHNFTSGAPANTEMRANKLQDQGWDPERDVSIITQAPEVAGSALKAGQIDAHADFVPFGELFPFRGIARKIYDGSSSGIPTTNGIQVRSDFAEKYPELVIAYLKATIEANRLIREHPEELC